jgi:hypothetical protein
MVQLMVNNRSYIIHKAPHKKGRRHDYDIYKRNHIITPKEVVTVVDLGYLGIEPDFPDQLSVLPYRKEIKIYHKRKKSITKFIQKRG